MKLFFDTSVLLPSFLEDHEHHEPSLEVFLRANRKNGFCGAHSLAELYATATRLPGAHRLSGDQVLRLIENIRERLTIVTLGAGEYATAIERAAAAGIAGGTIYDAPLIACADKARADVIYTWNIRHFERFSPDVTARLRTPERA